MKNIETRYKLKYLILAFVSVICFSSCEDFLESEKANEVVVADVQDVKGILAGYLYSQEIQNAGNSSINNYRKYKSAFNEEQTYLFLLQSDDLNVDQYVNYPDFSRRKSNFDKSVSWENVEPYADLWNGGYATVGLMNSLIKELSGLDSYEQDEFERVKGEVLAIRAFNIFKLLQYFAPYNNNELGIPLNLDSDNIDKNIARWSQDEVYSKIISDLTEVLSYTASPDDLNLYYNTNVVNAILAQVYMYKAMSPAQEDDDWANAATHAENAMVGKSLCSSVSDLDVLFHEPIEKARMTSGLLIKDNAHTLFSYLHKSPNGYSSCWGPVYMRYEGYVYGMPIDPNIGYVTFIPGGVKISSELMAAYDADDYRVFKTALPPAIPSLITGEGDIYKYSNIFGDTQQHEAIHMFRMADMQLIRAEAAIRQGNTSDATALLNEFKTSRNASITSYTDVKAEILLERRKEFVGELDMRWIDMKRLGVTFTRSYNNTDNADAAVEYTLAADDYRYTFFIPEESELYYNDALEQNPGW